MWRQTRLDWVGEVVFVNQQNSFLLLNGFDFFLGGEGMGI